jgi:hypothetical protein
MDGKSWKEIGRAPVDLPEGAEHKLGVISRGSEFKVTLGGKEVLTARDESFTAGTVGLRVVDTHACFGELKVRALGGR